MTEIISADYIAYAKNRFALNWDGVHGAAHWARVRLFGLAVGRVTGADLKAVEVFAFIHDLCRHNDDYDPNHGPRAAALLATINDEFFQLNATQLALVQKACNVHTRGTQPTDPTLAACLDGDRLDLWRVGITPDPARLCTAVAGRQSVIDWAMSVTDGMPIERPSVFVPR
jgi:uncharacterized protein